jgi:hypothetical protein
VFVRAGAVRVESTRRDTAGLYTSSFTHQTRPYNRKESFVGIIWICKLWLAEGGASELDMEHKGKILEEQRGVVVSE